MAGASSGVAGLINDDIGKSIPSLFVIENTKSGDLEEDMFIAYQGILSHEYFYGKIELFYLQKIPLNQIL